MKLLKVSLFALVWIVLTTVPALAQENGTETIFCGHLTSVDCAQFVLAEETMEGLTSAISERQVEISFSGMPLNGSLRISNRMSFVADPAIVARLQELNAMDAETLASDPLLLTEMITLPLEVDVAQTNIIEFSPELSDALAIRFGVDVPGEMIFATRLVDGILYVNVANFAEQMPAVTTLGDWVGIEMSAFMPALIEQSVADAIAQAETDPTQARDGVVSPTPGSGLASVTYTEIEAPYQTPLLAEYMDLFSMGSIEVDGQPATVYRMHVNTPRYFASPLFAERLGAVLQGGGEAAPVPAPLVASIAVLGSVVFNGLDIQVTQTIGQNVPYLFDSETHIHWQLAPFGRTIGRPSSPAIDVTTTITNRLLNEMDEIPVPEGAFVPPLELIMSMISSFQ